MPRTLAVIQQKGGVGKTTLVAGLAGAMSKAGLRVLVVDMDPQANLSQTVLRDYKERTDAGLATTYELTDEDLDPDDVKDVILRSDWPGVDVIPSETALAKREREGSTGIETRMRVALAAVPAGYDAILIDCPPSLGTCTANALLASDGVVLVANPDTFSESAMAAVGTTLSRLRRAYGVALPVEGLVVNAYEKTLVSDRVMAEFRAEYGDVLLAVIPKRAVIRSAIDAKTSVFDLPGRPASEVAAQYAGVAARLRLVPAPTVDLTDPVQAAV